MREGFSIQVHREESVSAKTQMEDVELDTACDDAVTVTSFAYSITSQRTMNKTGPYSWSIRPCAMKTLIIFAITLTCILLLVLHRIEQKDTRHNTPLNDKNATLVTNDFISTMVQDGSTAPLAQRKEKVYLPFNFFVMGDTPYTPGEETLLATQVAQIDPDDTMFIVHVGDLMRKNDCHLNRYQKSARILFDGTSVPTMILPGDNDIMDCPTKNRLQRAMRRFRKNLINDTNIESSDLSKTFERQDERQENFAFWEQDVLFVGLNMLAKKDTRNVKWFWNRQFEENIQWFLEHFDKHESDARAIVIFAHSTAARQVFRRIKKHVRYSGIPVLYLHGNGHTFEMQSTQNDFVRIMVDRGGIAPPLKVSVLDVKTPYTYFSQDGRVAINDDERKFYLFSGLFIVDRGLPL